jgi:hypothetical protein
LKDEIALNAGIRTGHPLDFQLAQLRHAYSLLMSESVKDHRQFANGLIAPAIEAIEQYLTDAREAQAR